MNEKVFKTMGLTGAGAIVLGIVIVVAGLAAGIMSIVNGSLLLKRGKDVTF